MFDRFSCDSRWLGRFLIPGVCVCLLGVSPLSLSRAAVSIDFEQSQGYQANQPLDGQQDWEATNTQSPKPGRIVRTLSHGGSQSLAGAPKDPSGRSGWGVQIVKPGVDYGLADSPGAELTFWVNLGSPFHAPRLALWYGRLGAGAVWRKNKDNKPEAAFVLRDALGNQMVSDVVFPMNQWVQVRMLMNFSAHQGQGSAWVSYRTSAKAAWKTVPDLQDHPLGMDDPKAVDLAKRGSLWIRADGSQVHLDDIHVRALNDDQLSKLAGVKGATTSKSASSSGPQSLSVPQVKGHPITLDGRADEAAWDQAISLQPFRVLGRPEKQADFQTHSRAMVVDGWLYLYLKADETDKTRLAVTTGDVFNWSLDGLEIFLSHDRLGFDQLAVNVDGSTWQGGSQVDYARTWYAVGPEDQGGLRWEASTSIEDKSWSAEVRIALDRLAGSSKDSPPTDVVPLYANIARRRPHSHQPHTSWAGIQGKTFAVPNQFIPMQVPVPAKGIADLTTKSDASAAHWTRSGDTPASTWTVGQPILWQRQANQTQPLRAQVDFIFDNVQVDRSIEELVRQGLAQTGASGKSTVQCRLLNKDEMPQELLKDLEVKRLQSPEAFHLTITPDRMVVAGRSQAGVLRGLATLAMLGSQAKSQPGQALPCGQMWDGPAMAFRGLMTGASRQRTAKGWSYASQPEDYKQQLDILFLLRANAMMIYVTPWTGLSQFPFNRHPNTGSPVTTKQQWREMAKYAQARGIEIIPVAQLWSGAGWLVGADNPSYRPLAVRPDLDYGTGRPQRKGKGWKNVCVSNPKAVALVQSLIDELDDAMPLKTLHVGLDELHYDDIVTHPLDKQRGLTASNYLVEAVKYSDQALQGRSTQLAIWGDMLDPRQNGKHLDASGLSLLKRLPQDVMIFDWKYAVKKPYASLGMFVDAGFKTVGCPWQNPLNITTVVNQIVTENAHGYLGVSYSANMPQEIQPELINAWPQGLAMAWVGSGDPKGFDVPPSVFYQQAAYQYGHEAPPANDVHQIVPTPGQLVRGAKLATALKMPPALTREIAKHHFTTSRGIIFKPFTEDGQLAGLVIEPQAEARAGSPIQITLNGQIQRLTFLHTTRRQIYEDVMANMQKQFKDASPGRYVFHYTDGTRHEVTLKYRQNIMDWNDRWLGRDCTLGAMGTLDHRYLVNLPLFEWVNPEPDKTLNRLEIWPGHRPGMNLVVLAVAVERLNESVATTSLIQRKQP